MSLPHGKNAHRMNLCLVTFRSRLQLFAKRIPTNVGAQGIEKVSHGYVHEPDNLTSTPKSYEERRMLGCEIKCISRLKGTALLVLVNEPLPN